MGPPPLYPVVLETSPLCVHAWHISVNACACMHGSARVLQQDEADGCYTVGDIAITTIAVFRLDQHFRLHGVGCFGAWVRA